MAAAAWIATQLLRPTFFAIPALLPLVLFRKGVARRRAIVGGALWASTWIVPAFVVGSNHVHHGVAAPSHIVTVNLRCYAVPRLQEELGQGKFRQLRRECLDRFRSMEPALRVRTERTEAMEYLSAHLTEAVVSHVHELGIQLVEPLRLYSVPRQSDLYPRGWEFGEIPLIAFWLLGCAGVARLAREDRALAIFLAGVAVLVLVPASFAHYTGGRLRFPLDLFFIPAAAISIERGWRWFGKRVAPQSR